MNSTVETPSGKDEAYENFPVGSWLLPKYARAHIATFYAFARAIDDVGDDPELSADDKLSRLDGFEAVLLGRDDGDGAFAKAKRMRASMIETSVPFRHGVDLIAAFKQDCVKNRYADWQDLLDYCMLSAAPVGRYLLDLHGGSKDGYGPSDALCMALQVINHLQDCQDDYRTLDRVYVPQDWIMQSGVDNADFDLTRSPENLRRVFDRTITATRELMIEAHKLPKGLKSCRLAMESATIIRIADALLDTLSANDPLAGRIILPKWRYASCFFLGVIEVLLRR